MKIAIVFAMLGLYLIWYQRGAQDAALSAQGWTIGWDGRLSTPPGAIA